MILQRTNKAYEMRFPQSEFFVFNLNCGILYSLGGPGFSSRTAAMLTSNTKKRLAYGIESEIVERAHGTTTALMSKLILK